MSFLMSVIVFSTRSVAQKDTKQSSHLIFNEDRNSYERENEFYTERDENSSHDIFSTMIPESSASALDQSNHLRRPSKTENYEQRNQTHNRISQLYSGFSTFTNFIKTGLNNTKNNVKKKITQNSISIHALPKDIFWANFDQSKLDDAELSSHSQKNELDEIEPEYQNQYSTISDINTEVHSVQCHSPKKPDATQHQTVNDIILKSIHEDQKPSIISNEVIDINDDGKTIDNKLFENSQMSNIKSDQEEIKNISSDNSSGYESIEEDLASEGESNHVKPINFEEAGMRTDMNLLEELHRAEIQKIRRSYIEYQKASEEKIRHFYHQVILQLLKFDRKAKFNNKNQAKKKVDRNESQSSKNHINHEELQNDLATHERQFRFEPLHSLNIKHNQPSYITPLLYKKESPHDLDTIPECQEPLDEHISDDSGHICDIKIKQENPIKMEDSTNEIGFQLNEDMNAQSKRISEKKHGYIESALRNNSRDSDKTEDFFPILNDIQKNQKSPNDVSKDNINFDDTIIMNINKYLFSALQYLLSSFAEIPITKKSIIIVSNDKVPVNILRDNLNFNRFVLDSFNDAGKYFLDRYYIDQSKNFTRCTYNSNFLSKIAKRNQNLINMNLKSCHSRKNEDQSEKHSLNFENNRIKPLEQNIKNRQLFDVFDRFHALQNNLSYSVN